jgi:hypothetical protein
MSAGELPVLVQPMVMRKHRGQGCTVEGLVFCGT